MEQLLLVNPRPKRRRKSARRRGRMPPALARYWATHRSGKRRVSAVNPRRRRRKHHSKRRKVYASNPRHYHRRARRRSNPRGGMRIANMKGLIKGAAMPGLIGAGGALVLDVAMGYAQPYLPASLQSGWFNVGVKALGAVGVGAVVGKVLGREKGRIAMVGGVTVVLYSALKGMVKTAMPSLPGLSGYADYTPYSVPRMGAYMPGPTGTPGIRGLGYVSPAPTLSPRMGAYMPRMPMNVAPAMGDYGDGM